MISKSHSNSIGGCSYELFKHFKNGIVLIEESLPTTIINTPHGFGEVSHSVTKRLLNSNKIITKIFVQL